MGYHFAMAPTLFSVPKLAAVVGPYAQAAWASCAKGPLLTNELIAKSGLEPEAWTGGDSDVAWSLERHAARVAYLAANGWDEPIELSFYSVPILLDGNHRLAAAHYLGLQQIWGYWGGAEWHAQKFFYEEMKVAV